MKVHLSIQSLSTTRTVHLPLLSSSRGAKKSFYNPIMIIFNRTQNRKCIYIRRRCNISSMTSFHNAIVLALFTSAGLCKDTLLISSCGHYAALQSWLQKLPELCQVSGPCPWVGKPHVHWVPWGQKGHPIPQLLFENHPFKSNCSTLKTCLALHVRVADRTTTQCLHRQPLKKIQLQVSNCLTPSWFLPM